jgi:hypothetical protein
MRDEATCRNGELGGKRMSVSGKAQPTDARIRPEADFHHARLPVRPRMTGRPAQHGPR